MRPFLLLTTLAFAGCGPGHGNPAPGSGPIGATSGPLLPCVWTARAGGARGVWYDYKLRTEVPIDLPEVMCGTLATRDGAVSGMRLVYGTYDPASEYPQGAEPLLLLQPSYYSGSKLTNESAGMEIRLPGHSRATVNGTLTMTDSFHGSFSGDKTHFDFSCDAADPMTGAKHLPAPSTPPPGTAVITKALYEHVFVVDGVECDSSSGDLRVTRNDVGSSCNFVRFALYPSSRNRLIGPSTYPEYFSFISPLITQFDDRTFNMSHPGTLELRGEHPMTGFASFTFGPGFAPDRIEFTCPQ